MCVLLMNVRTFMINTLLGNIKNKVNYTELRIMHTWLVLINKAISNNDTQLLSVFGKNKFHIKRTIINMFLEMINMDLYFNACPVT